ncbi:MAG: uncharacterized protein QOG38_1651 [Hyphomicrobiales bacterium]|nr:uncharacterized protein [Hyphomicrobiales bacterium]
MQFIFVCAVGLLAGAISGIIGTGSSIMLVPVLVWQFGPKEAVPIMAVAAIIGNFSRILAWWREVDWRATFAYSVAAVPCAVLGAKTLLVLPSRAVDIAIGLFLLAMIPGRRWLASHNFKLKLWHLAVIGAAVGYITGIVVTTGPITVPIFLMYGLVKGAFLATEAAGSLAIYVAKVLAFRGFGAMPLDTFVKGLIAGGALMAGTFLSKRFVVRLDAESFRYILDGLMLISGFAMLWNAFFS